MNEVAGGRKLLETVARAGRAPAPSTSPSPRRRTSRSPARSSIATSSRDAARSRVEVTQEVLAEFGIEAPGRRLRPRPAARARRRRPRLRARPRSCSRACRRRRSASLRKDLVAWAEAALRGAGDAHPGPDRGRRRALGRHPHARGRHADRRQPRSGRPPQVARAAERPHRYTIICPKSGELSREEVCERLAAHAGRALPRRDRRDRPADEPGALRGGPERDRALPRSTTS